ncbi:hypothetical protein C8R43DRAFT_1230695 [Mycena crocata]|nr:hypothetical protein C8R43DRAFT_1230695 [Mycena crocata]
MAPTSTLQFIRRDLDANDVASIFNQPMATPSPWIDPNIPEGFSLPILLGLIGLCVLGSIMVFILWRWNSVYFSDLPADHKDLLTQWKTRHLKPTDAASSATASTETLVEPKLAPPAPPPPAYTAAADNSAPGVEDALFHLTRSNTIKNQRRTVQVFSPQLITSVPPVPRPSQAITGSGKRAKTQGDKTPEAKSLPIRRQTMVHTSFLAPPVPLCPSSIESSRGSELQQSPPSTRGPQKRLAPIIQNGEHIEAVRAHVVSSQFPALP